jgi:hypothetical protein
MDFIGIFKFKYFNFPRINYFWANLIPSIILACLGELVVTTLLVCILI